MSTNNQMGKKCFRNAQIGTIGLLMTDIDLPLGKSGITPDIVVNPRSISYPTQARGTGPMTRLPLRGRGNE